MRSGSRPGCRRCGFTLIELIVVLGILAVLITLLLAGIQAAREAGRRAQCLNNLRQIGLALANYQSAMSALPPAYATSYPGGRPAADELGGNWSWGAATLPQIDQAALFHSINIGRLIDDPSNRTARAARLAVHLCPSSDDPGPARVRLWTGEDAPTLRDLAPGNYVASAGTRALGGSPWVDVPRIITRNGNEDGLMYCNSAVTPADIRDGLGATLLTGERSRHFAEATWVGTMPLGTVHMVCTRARVPTQQCVMTNSLVLGHTGPENRDRRPVWVDRPNFPEGGADSYSSRHPGGAHFGFADGSCRFIKETIDPVLFGALATRAGSEVVGSDF